jgi:2-C-methyl-D-erythritol 2,4-cyclodiphosphate synthase
MGIRVSRDLQLKLLAQVSELVRNQGMKLGNLDSIIIAQRPKQSPVYRAHEAHYREVLKTDINEYHGKSHDTDILALRPGRGDRFQAAVCLILCKLL